MAALRTPPAERGRIVRGWLVVLAVGSAFQLTPLSAALDASLLDEGFAILRRMAVKPAGDHVAVIGIDEETLRAFPEPLALWHGYLRDILRGLAAARPRAVGVDVELPERSYDFLRAGADRELLEAILALRAVAPLTIALGVDQAGAVKPVHGPFAAAAGENGTGVAVWPLDGDGRVRRFDERLGEAGAHVPTFTGTMARKLGIDPRPGWIDFALGERFGYVPAYQVREWIRSEDTGRLHDAFRGRVVLLGSVLPFADRHRVPVPLAQWETGPAAPGVLVHAQALRSLLGPGLVQAAGPAFAFVLVALASLVWFACARIALGSAVLLALLAAFAGGALWLLHQGIFVPIASAWATAVLAAGSRAGHDAWLHRRERERLRHAFAGYVSPNVLDLILRGELDTRIGSGRRMLCVLFADIRNFTAMSEQAEPEVVVSTLNAYYERMTAAIHRYDGTVDNFRGDGIMCFFGAPLPAANPCQQGFLAAADMLAELDRLNRELAAQGFAALRIGVSLAYGEAIVGRIGAAERHEYTAVGDVANVSARLEGMTKELGYPLLLTSAVVERVAAGARFDDLGAREIRGHAPVHVYGWPTRKPQSGENELLRAGHG